MAFTVGRSSCLVLPRSHYSCDQTLWSREAPLIALRPDQPDHWVGQSWAFFLGLISHHLGQAGQVL